MALKRNRADQIEQSLNKSTIPTEEDGWQSYQPLKNSKQSVSSAASREKNYEVFWRPRDEHNQELREAELLDFCYANEAEVELARKYVRRWTGSHDRLTTVMEFEDALAPSDWLRLLGDFWTSSENVRKHRLRLRRIMGTVGPLRELMSQEENELYDARPEKITCYRGSDRSVLVGASWSLNKDVASRFPFMQRYYAENPVLITAWVRKSNVLAVKLERKEEEIITFSAHRVAVETITPPPRGSWPPLTIGDLLRDEANGSAESNDPS
jgi:hypothetical protein